MSNGSCPIREGGLRPLINVGFDSITVLIEVGLRPSDVWYGN